MRVMRLLDVSVHQLDVVKEEQLRVPIQSEHRIHSAAQVDADFKRLNAHTGFADQPLKRFPKLLMGIRSIEDVDLELSQKRYQQRVDLFVEVLDRSEVGEVELKSALEGMLASGRTLKADIEL